MRKNKVQAEINDAFRLMIIDDDEGIIDSVSALLRRMGYVIDGYLNPVDGLTQLKKEHYDLLILDYFMLPMHGDEVVENIRYFDKELYILLLTGYKDLAPPIETIKMLDIQAYCEKSERLDQLLLLVESGIKSISQMRTIKKFRDGLNNILGAVPKIYQLQPIGNILEEILQRILPLLNSEDAFILVDNLAEIANADKSIFRGIGIYNVDVQDFTNMLDPKLMEAIGTARTKPEIIVMKDGVILPLINELRKAIGVIYVSSRDVDEGIELLEIYAGQAASSINNAFLHSLVNVKNEELNRTYAQLKTRYMDTIEALRLAVDAKDVYTRGHSDRVAYFSSLIGKRYGLSEQELETLRIGGVFHDIGKIGTADDILLKTEKLDKADFEEIKRHPMKGALILSAVSMFSDVVPIVRHHHERIDGKGYPDGLKGDEIPLSARIIAVADAFDAMTSDRQYRLRLSLEEAIDQLKMGAGTQFDKNVVETFLEIIKQEDVLKNINQHLSETSAVEV
jgi:HD-GYP domain-containing protein (c-di-GMP phosphodiesterase class II)/ActR/RegA family two-component response regulator